MDVKFSQIWNKVSQVLESCVHKIHIVMVVLRDTFSVKVLLHIRSVCVAYLLNVTSGLLTLKKFRDTLGLKLFLPYLLYLRGMNKEILEAASPFAPHRKMNLYSYLVSARIIPVVTL